MKRRNCIKGLLALPLMTMPKRIAEVGPIEHNEKFTEVTIRYDKKIMIERHEGKTEEELAEIICDETRSLFNGGIGSWLSRQIAKDILKP